MHLRIQRSATEKSSLIEDDLGNRESIIFDQAAFYRIQEKDFPRLSQRCA
jgi:hypothetical protein